jgi:NDP-sugar pyrophosphorylase family protein
MQCIILAAGLGTRMGELTKHVPKPMLEVAGRPLLAHKIDMLPKEIDEVVLVIGYKGDVVRAYFGDEWHDRRIRYAEQKELNGSAGAVRLARDLVGERFLVTMGDDLYHPEDLADLMRHPLSILGYFVDDATSFGIMTKDAEGNLLEVVERPHGFAKGLVNTGAYVLTQEFFIYEPVHISETETGLPQTLAVMAKDRPVRVESARAWQPVGRPEDLPAAESFLSEWLPKQV